MAKLSVLSHMMEKSRNVADSQDGRVSESCDIGVVDNEEH